MARIGQLLVRAGLVSDNNVARALGVQQFAGGRLGTLLLERGSIDEDGLGQNLALQHGCEYIPWRVLSDVAPVVLAALPAKFAIKHAAVPYGRGEGFLKIALRDPGDLRILDELFFVTGRKIIAGVTPEVRIYQALEKYYGERRTPRYAILAEKISRPARTSKTSASPAPPPPPDFFPSPPRKPGAPPAQQDLWGELSEQDAAEPRIMQSWKVPDKQVGGWAGTASPVSEPSSPSEPETISWEEMPSFSALWIPEPVPPLPELAPPQAPPDLEQVLLRQTPPVGPPMTDTAPVSQAEQPPVVEPSYPAAPTPSAEPAPTAPALAEATPPSPPPLADLTPVEAEEQPVSEDVPAPARPALAPAVSFAKDFPEFASALDRDSIATAAIAALARRFVRGAVFVSKPDAVGAWGGFGDGVSSDELKTLAIPWKEPSVFLNVRLSRSFYLGALPPLPRHEALAIAMGTWAQECLVQPVLIKEKPVAFLYAEFAPDQGATPMDLAFMRELAFTASSAFACAIRLKKKQI